MFLMTASKVRENNFLCVEHVPSFFATCPVGGAPLITQRPFHGEDVVRWGPIVHIVGRC
jgi:hypothetical protein